MIKQSGPHLTSGPSSSLNDSNGPEGKQMLPSDLIYGPDQGSS